MSPQRDIGGAGADGGCLRVQQLEAAVRSDAVARDATVVAEARREGEAVVVGDGDPAGVGLAVALGLTKRREGAGALINGVGGQAVLTGGDPEVLRRQQLVALGEGQAERAVPGALLGGRLAQRPVAVAGVGRDDVGLLLLDDHDVAGPVEGDLRAARVGRTAERPGRAGDGRELALGVTFSDKWRCSPTAMWRGHGWSGDDDLVR